VGASSGHTTSLPDDLFREHSMQLDISELAIGAWMN